MKFVIAALALAACSTGHAAPVCSWDRPGANRRDDDLSQKGLVVSCFAARAAAQPDFIHPMGFEGLGTERVFRPAGAFQGAAAP